MKRASSQGLDGWTIGELARRSGVAASAIRYYEKQGLLPKPPRRHNWRRYDRAALAQLQLVAQARASGFGVREIKALVAAWRTGADGRRAMLNKRIERTHAERARLEREIETMEAALACACTEPGSCGLRLKA